MMKIVVLIDHNSTISNIKAKTHKHLFYYKIQGRKQRTKKKGKEKEID